MPKYVKIHIDVEGLGDIHFDPSQGIVDAQRYLRDQEAWQETWKKLNFRKVEFPLFETTEITPIPNNNPCGEVGLVFQFSPDADEPEPLRWHHLPESYREDDE